MRVPHRPEAPVLVLETVRLRHLLLYQGTNGKESAGGSTSAILGEGSVDIFTSTSVEASVANSSCIADSIKEA